MIETHLQALFTHPSQRNSLKRTNLHSCNLKYNRLEIHQLNDEVQTRSRRLKSHCSKRARSYQNSASKQLRRKLLTTQANKFLLQKDHDFSLPEIGKSKI